MTRVPMCLRVCWPSPLASDFPRMKEVLDAIGYEGWVQIEGALPAGMDLMEAYRANLAFLRGVLKS